jgi:hypothetical protein
LRVRAQAAPEDCDEREGGDADGALNHGTRLLRIVPPGSGHCIAVGSA